MRKPNHVLYFCVCTTCAGCCRLRTILDLDATHEEPVHTEHMYIRDDGRSERQGESRKEDGRICCVRAERRDGMIASIPSVAINGHSYNGASSAYFPHCLRWCVGYVRAASTVSLRLYLTLSIVRSRSVHGDVVAACQIVGAHTLSFTCIHVC